MEMLLFLMAFPALIALLLVVIRNNSARNVLVVGGAAVTAAASVILACTNLGAAVGLVACWGAVADATGTGVR